MSDFFTAELTRQRQADLLREATSHRLARDARATVEPSGRSVRNGFLQRVVVSLQLRRSGRVQPA
jgi:hypothetical protein